MSNFKSLVSFVSFRLPKHIKCNKNEYFDLEIVPVTLEHKSIHDVYLDKKYEQVEQYYFKTIPVTLWPYKVLRDHYQNLKRDKSKQNVYYQR